MFLVQKREKIYLMNNMKYVLVEDTLNPMNCQKFNIQVRSLDKVYLIQNTFIQHHNNNFPQIINIIDYYYVIHNLRNHSKTTYRVIWFSFVCL